MEMPIISRISDFEAGISRLQNPSLLSKILSRSDEASPLHAFWTWGALILAVVAAFSSLIRKAKLLLLRVPKPDSLISQTFLQSSVSSDDDDDDDDDDDVTSCSSSDGAESEDEDDSFFTQMVGRGGRRRRESFDGDSEMDFRVAGSGSSRSGYGHVLRRWHRCLSDAAASGESQLSRSVVKLWDGLGLGVDGSTGSISVWDLTIKDKVRTFSAGRVDGQAVCAPSPLIMVSAVTEAGCRTTMRVWDARVGNHTQAVVAEWAPRGTEVLGIGAGGVEKVYVRDGFRRVTVRDLRTVSKPLPEEAEEADWYNALSDAREVTAPAAVDGGDRGVGLVQRRRRQG